MLQYSRELYPHTALLKAAYSFTDRAYIHLDADSSHYLVELTQKDGREPVLPSEFDNEMLEQALRHEVYLQTRTIRELLVARTVSSAMIELVDEDALPIIEETQGADNPFDVELDSTIDNTPEAILADWFEANESNDVL